MSGPFLEVLPLDSLWRDGKLQGTAGHELVGAGNVANNVSTQDSCVFLENSCEQERGACGDERTEKVNRIIVQKLSPFQ
jgi:hypothetical protein